MGDSATSFSTSFPFSIPISTTTSSTSSYFHQADMFDQNKTSTWNDINPVKQRSSAKFYYFNRFLSLFYTFFYDDVLSEGVKNNDAADNGNKISSSYQNGSNADKVRDTFYRNKPEKEYHPSEYHSLLSYQNGGEEEEEEVEK